MDLAMLPLYLRMVMQKAGTVIGSIVLLLAASLSCSSPTGSTGSEILQQLLDIPLISFPPETVENASDPGFQATTGCVREILYERYTNFQYWIEPILDQKLRARTIGESLRWRNNRTQNPDQTLILTATPGDTIRFRIDFEGPDWGPAGAWFIEGHIIPAIGKGGLHTGGGISISWGPTDYGCMLGIDLGNTRLIGWDHEVANFTTGGGSVTWSRGNHYEHFEAQWDASGHGIWWGYGQGSGEW